MLGLVVLAPALTRPTIAILLVVGVAAVWLAAKSVAYPLALSGVPSLITSINGTNPLPKGGASILIAGWIGLGVVLAVVRRRQGRALHGLMSLPCAMALLLLALMVLRLGASTAATYGTQKTELYVADNLVLLVGGVFVGCSRQNLRLFVLITLAVIVVGSLMLVEQLAAGTALQQYGSGSGRYTLNAQEGAIGLGRTSADGALLAIGMVLIARKAWARYTALAIIPLLLLAMFSAGSRGPVVAFIVALLLMIVLSATTGRARRQLLLVGAGLVGAALVVPLVVPGSALGRVLSALLGSSSGLSSNGRSALWALAFSTFKSHVWLGIGTGSFATLNAVQYPHNIFLETGVELGVFGALATAVMIGSMLQRMRWLWEMASRRDRLGVALLLALFISAFINALFSGQISDNSEIWLWGGIAIGVCAQARVPVRQSLRRHLRTPTSPGAPRSQPRHLIRPTL